MYVRNRPTDIHSTSSIEVEKNSFMNNNPILLFILFF